MNRLVFILCFLVLPLFMAGQSLPIGEIIDTVRCIRQPSQSYALYLPSNYTTSKAWPVIMIFEPAARGVLPITKFCKAAEAFGYIVLASNNSRNGSWDIALEASEAMLSEVFERYSVDKERIYTSGFSGGSRVAASVAVITGQVEGVIACGAGFPNVPEYKPKAIHKFSYIALVGDKDMNYQEHIKVKNELDRMGLTNHKLIFSGIHEWPPEDQIVRACHWLELQAHKKKLNTHEEWKVEQAYEVYQTYADSLFNAGNLVLAQEVYAHFMEDFEGLYNLSPIEQKLKELNGSKAYKKQLKAAEKLNRKELKHQEEIDNAFAEALRTRLQVKDDSTVKTVEWWYDEIEHWEKMSGTDDTRKRNMALRLTNLIWARFATSSFNLSQRGDLSTAILFNGIWLKAEPESRWAHWSMARLLAQKGDVEKVVAHITHVATGNKKFSKKTLYREPAFAGILNDPRILEMIRSLNLD